MFQPESESNATKIIIKQSGYYKIEFTVFLKNLDANDVNKVEIFKKTNSGCTTLIQLRVRLYNDISTNGEGIYSLSAGDEILTIASHRYQALKPEVEGDDDGIRTILVVTKMWY